MKLQVKVIKVSEVAMLTIDSDEPDQVRVNILETAKKFPKTLDFQKPEKDDELIVQIDQIG